MAREIDWQLFEKAADITASALRGAMGGGESQPADYAGKVFKAVWDALKEAAAGQHGAQSLLGRGRGRDGDRIGRHPVRDRVAGRVEVLTERAHDVALGEDPCEALALHHKRRADPSLAHHRGGLSHGRGGLDGEQRRRHDVADGGHGLTLAAATVAFPPGNTLPRRPVEREREVVRVLRTWMGIAVLAVLAVGGSEEAAVEGVGGDSGGARPGGEPFTADQAEEAVVPRTATLELPVVGPDVIKTADLEVEVARDGLGDAIATATTMAHRYQGFVVSSSTEGAEARRGTVVLRVPADAFEEALNDLRGLGEVRGQEVRGEDVGQEFVDLEARLRHLEAQERVMLGLFDQAVTVADTIRIQHELSAVQLRIEEIEGRLRYLRDQTSLSTISVALVEEGAAVPGALDRAWSRAFDGLLSVVAGMVVALGYVVPIAAIGLAALVVFRRVRPSGATG